MKSIYRRLQRLHKNRYEFLYLYRLFKYKLYPKFFKRPLLEVVCINSNGVKYELVAKALGDTIRFNNQELSIKKYSDTQGFIWLKNIDGEIKYGKNSYRLKKYNRRLITKDSIIIFSDRYEKADDNGEFLYEWVMSHKPDYKNVYFAVSKTSSHYSRLEKKGFRLLDFDSVEFRQKYKQADVIVSSVFADYIENHRALRYFNSTPKSRFVCLQHGVTAMKSADLNINAQQKINSFVLSIELEREIFEHSKIWFKEQNPVIGMSRTIAPVNSSNTGSTILYVPSWTEEAYNKSNIEQSKLYKSIENFVKSEELSTFLARHNLTFKVIIHPQVCQQFESWQKLRSDRIQVENANDVSYKEEIAKCLALITDTSSVLFDAMFRGKPIYIYRPISEVLENKGIDMGEFVTTYKEIGKLLEEVEKVIAGESKQQIPNNCMLTDVANINERLWELIING